MSSLKAPVDLKALENELDDAVRADELYKLQNDAKFRAIEQKVPTYDHFRNMVLTAHLKPLERSELQKKAQVSWNRSCSEKQDDLGQGRSQQHEGELELNDAKFLGQPGNKELQNEQEFLKTWKYLNDDYEEKFKLLAKYRDSLKEKFFRVEVPADVLADMLKAILYCCSADKVEIVIDILENLNQCNRLSLSLAMISASDKYYIRLLFDKLLHIARDRQELSKIRFLIMNYCIERGK